jgi:hypothetical protein
LIDRRNKTALTSTGSKSDVKKTFALMMTFGSACVILAVLLPMLLLGPYFHTSKKPRLLSSLPLSDKSCLYLVQHWNQTPTEPYSVILYRLHPNGFAESLLIGFEEAYWWSGSLKQKDSNTVNVISDGALKCSYNIKTSARTWTDGSITYTVQQGDYIHISNQLWSIDHKLTIPQPSH